MAGVYSADGSFNVTVVGENDLPIGLYAANGSFRVTQDAGPGLYAPNGAWRIGSSGTGAYTPDGALNGFLVGSKFYPAGGVAAIFLNDTFTDTNGVAITAHTPELGGAWSAQFGNSPATPSLITSNRLYSTSGAAIYRNAAVPPSANYYVEGIFDFLSTVAGDNVGVFGRASAGANTYYTVRWSQTAGTFAMFRIIGGVATQIGSSYVTTFTSGSKIVRLTMAGSLITASIDGVLRISATDTNISAAGFAGARAVTPVTSTTGIHLTSIKAVTV